MSLLNGNKPALKDRPDCWKCLHFAVSWDPKLPYLCRLIGFKSRVIPAMEVMRIDGKACEGFAAKPTVPVKPPL